MQELYEIPVVPARPAPVRRAMQRAREQLNGHLLSLVLALLFCLVALYAWHLLSVLLGTLLVAVLTDALLAVALYFAVLAIALVALLLPLWAGRARMAGLAGANRPCEPYELFYYFQSARRWLRGIGVMLLFLPSVVCPPLFGAAALYAGKETLTLGGALREAYRTRPRTRDVLGFWAQVLWHAALSALTLGVLWMLYYAHHTAVAYFDLTMDPKGDLQ